MHLGVGKKISISMEIMDKGISESFVLDLYIATE
jgi:hypothetical protein